MDGVMEDGRSSLASAGPSLDAMDTDELVPSVLEHRVSSSGLRFYLHPLVMISMSDHYVRKKVNNFEGQGGARVLGILLGQQNGRHVDISNSFELVYQMTAKGIELDDQYLQKKIDQYKQTFPKLDVVGWYSTGNKIQPEDMPVHRTMMILNETPVYLLFNPVIDPLQKELPLLLYESELHNVNGIPQHIFVQAKLEIETSEAERIAVNQIAKVLPANVDRGADQVTAHLAGFNSAAQMLTSRIKALKELLAKTADGSVEVNQGLLRQTATLIHSFPAATGSNFDREFLTEYNDAMLGVYMASLTKGVNNMADVVDKLNVVYDAAGSGGRRKFAPMLPRGSAMEI